MKDKAGETYWSEQWRGLSLPPSIRLSGRSLAAVCYRQFHRLWRQYLPAVTSRPVQFLEVGCARSVWLPYFAREWGYEVAGLDYSEVGCEQARAILAREGVSGEIHHQDLFTPQSHQRQAFDVVFSNGVVEHFEDPERVLQALAAYLRPGGMVVSIIPNLAGWLGRAQAWLSKEIMATHVVFRREDLQAVHQAAGYRTDYCDYFIFLNLYVPNPGRRMDKWRHLIFAASRKGLARLIGWMGPSQRPSQRTGSYIVYIGQKVQDEAPLV